MQSLLVFIMAVQEKFLSKKPVRGCRKIMILLLYSLLLKVFRGFGGG